MDTKTILSVGIDVGTSTTQLIFSSLHLVNRAGPTQVPRYEFTDRKILYQSPVTFTPINSDGVVMQDKLSLMVKEWFKDAGMKPEDIETGAIIITGESLKATNAKATVMDLSEDLGDFVVASAGPHLESIIAGRGSGAADYSKRNGKTVLNIDIGGGTSNYVVFSVGNVVDTACLNVGGRLIETDQSGKVTTIHKPAKHIIKDIFNEDRSSLSTEELNLVADRMAETINLVAQGRPDQLCMELLQTPPLKSNHVFDAVFISGGVGACCFESVNGSPFRFGDIGPLLAMSILKNSGMSKLPLKEPECTVRATVIGAGAWSLSLSGSTVWTESSHLPLKNLPVVIPSIDWSQTTPLICTAILEAAMRLDLNLDIDAFAVALPEGMPIKYAMVQHVTKELAKFYNDHVKSSHPIIVSIKEDAGKITGMELKPLINGKPLAVIDEVEVRDGDYIDLGKPLFEGGLVPLTIKSLAFPS